MNIRKIIPIFKFEFEHKGTEFAHIGNFDGAEYNISLKYHGKVSLAYLNGNYEKKITNAAESTRGSYYYINDYYSKQRSVFTYPIAEYFLIVDVKQEEPPPELLFMKSSTQIDLITRCFLEALHLHCSNGLYYEKTYHYRFPLEQYQNKSIIMDTIPLYFRHFIFEDPSILKQEEIENCRKTFLSLLDRIFNKSPLNHIISLGYSYHRTTFKLENVSHKFLILMVIFESFFKKEKEKNASQAAKRISKLLPKVQNDQKGIYKDFFDNAPDCFCKIRNRIAHGDPNLNKKIVHQKYPKLCMYITKAIIMLIQIPLGAIDPTKDSYDEIDKYINKYYSILP